MAEIQPPNNMLLFRIANLNLTISKANWSTSYTVPPSVGFTILSELLLDFHGKSVGLMVNWTDEIIMAKLAKVRAGDKRKISLVESRSLQFGDKYESQIKIEENEMEGFKLGDEAGLKIRALISTQIQWLLQGRRARSLPVEWKLTMVMRAFPCIYPLKIRGIEDLPHTGNQFSWSGTRRGRKVYEKLDRAMGNVTWFDFFTTSSCRGLPIQRSDHGPLLISTKKIPNTSPHSFKRESFLTLLPDFPSLIANSWISKLS
ncbi:hypothetical protein LIER_38669 [Lithospermum erythrorhizon]|uniref:Uncharacterized protein n=1 Tax=Lithospermum erythrorhizon TaxID=34254 RepID=A0AAV3Q7W1_LITER